MWGIAGTDELWAKHNGRLLSPAAGPLSVEATFHLKELLLKPSATGAYNVQRTHQRAMARSRQVRVSPYRAQVDSETVCGCAGVTQAAVDVVFGGFGWLALTPIPVIGSKLWENTMAHATVTVAAHPGVPVYLRRPMLPFEAQGTTPKDWKT